jgi:hypothetical protein
MFLYSGAINFCLSVGKSCTVTNCELPHSSIKSLLYQLYVLVHMLFMARCIFRINLDAFFIYVEQVLNPEPKGKPLIVGGDLERRGVVASASYEGDPSTSGRLMSAVSCILRG